MRSTVSKLSHYFSVSFISIVTFIINSNRFKHRILSGKKTSFYWLLSFLLLLVLQGCNSTSEDYYFTETQVVNGNLGFWSLGEKRLRTANSETERFVSSDKYYMTGVHFSVNDISRQSSFLRKHDIKLTRFVGVGQVFAKAGPYVNRWKEQAIFETDSNNLWVSIPLDKGPARAGMFHRAASLDIFAKDLRSADRIIGLARQYMEVIGKPNKAQVNAVKTLQLIAEHYSPANEIVSGVLAQQNRQPDDLYKRIEKMWAEHGEYLANAEKINFEQRMQILNKMRPDLERALKLKGSQVFSFAESLLEKTAKPTILAGASYAENNMTLSPFAWAVVEPLNNVSRVHNLQNKNRNLPAKDKYKLLSLIQKWDEAKTYPTGLNSVGDLAHTLANLDVYEGKGVHKLHDNAHPMLDTLLHNTLSYTASKYRALGQKNWVKLEQVMARHAPFKNLKNSITDMQYLVNSYSINSDAFATIAWQEQSYKRLGNDNALKVLNLTTAALTPQNTQTLTDVYEYLEKRGLIATKAMLHLYDDSVQSIYKYKNKPYRSTETLAIAKELIVSFDPIWEESSNVGSAYVKRLHDLPWLHRPISRYFGMYYRSPKNLNLAANEQGVPVGHLAIVIENDVPVLTRSNYQDNLSFLLLANDREKVPTNPELKRIEKELAAEEKQIEAMYFDLRRDKKNVEFLNNQFNERVKAFERKNKNGNATNSERNQLMERRKQIGYRKIDLNEKNSKYTKVYDAFRKKRLSYNEEVSLQNGKALQSVVSQQNRILTDWFEQEVERHRTELKKNNVSEDEIELELASLRWILGLNESLPSTILARIPNQSFTLTEAPRYQMRVIVAEEAVMFIGGTSKTIASKIVQHYKNLLDRNLGYKAKKRIKKLVDKYIDQFGHWDLFFEANRIPSNDDIGSSLRGIIKSAVKKREN